MADENRLSSPRPDENRLSSQDSITVANSSTQQSPTDFQYALFPLDPEQERGQPLGSYVSRLSDGRIPSVSLVDSSIGTPRPGAESPWLEYDAQAPMEVYNDEQDGKQVVDHGIEVVPQNPLYELPYHSSDKANEIENATKRKRMIGCLPLWLFVALLVIAAILGVGLGVGLGLGLKSKFVNIFFYSIIRR